MDINYKSIGKRIKIARISKDVSQEKLAESAGISTVHLSNIENGHSRLSIKTLINIINTLEITADDVLAENISATRRQDLYEMSLLFEDCTDKEIHLLASILHATKSAIRETTF